MTISPPCVVTLQYKLTVPENETETFIEETKPEQPFVFLFGSGQLLPEFEQNLADKTSGDTFDFLIKAENAYGTTNPEMVVELPVEYFLDEKGGLDPALQVGRRVPMVSEDGQRLWGLILHMGLQTVRMDFNHALAGKDLHFVGQILEVRAAETEEIEHGHAHGPGGHQH